MKTVYLLRHAKSSWENPALSDFERPLAARGRAAAPLMASYMREKKLLPDLVLCSPARRTRETWELASLILGPEIEARFPRSIYMAPPSRLMRQICALPDTVQTVLVIGHNPGLEHLAVRLSGEGSKKKPLRRMEIKYPTAALAILRFDIAHWKDLGEGKGCLTRFVRPVDLE